MEHVKSSTSFRRTTSHETIQFFKPKTNLKHRSLSESDLNKCRAYLIVPLFPIQIAEKSRNLEDFTIIWLDENADKMQLRQLNKYCQIFGDMKVCVDYIEALPRGKIFFIVSESLCQKIIPIIHDLSQVEFVYIFCPLKIKHADDTDWMKIFIKIRGTFIDEQSLLIKLTKDVALLSNQLSSISVFSITKTEYQEKSVKDLNQEQATFMWFQLLIDTLINLPKNDKAKYQMIDECRLHYANNKIEEKKINDFATEYTPKSAISWYTRDSFLYRLLNKALRTENIDDIFKYRFFIADLHLQLSDLHADFIQKWPIFSKKKTLTVYRGQSMSATELKKIQDNIGGFIAINTFLSTTTSSAVAASFAGDGSGRPLLESVIFEIDIDPSKTTRPFANIQLLSVMKNENEIIFSIGTVFRIESVELITDDLWNVKLIISEKDDEKLKEVYSYLKNDLTMDTPSLQNLGDFLREMAEYEKAEHYYRLLINELPAQHEDIANIYNGIGVTYYERGLDDEAMKYFQDALGMKAAKYEVVAATYVNIGLVQTRQSQNIAALKSYQQAVEIMENNSAKPNMVLASFFLNIGSIYDRQGDYRTALEYFKKSLDIARSIIPLFHPFYITLYNNIGLVYDNLADYKLALNNFDAALTISQKILPPHHSSLVPIYTNIGEVFVSLCSYENALEYHDKALQTELKSSNLNRHTMASIYNNIGLAHQNSGSFVEALVNFEKALEFATEPRTLTSLFNNLGTTFLMLNNHEKAITNFQTAVELKLKYLDEKHPSLATTYHNLASLYQTIQDYPNALKYSEKTLNIDKITLPPNHPNLATTYNNIALIYYKMLDFNRALQYCEEAIRIMNQSSFPDNHPLTVLFRNTMKIVQEKLQKT
ncbi:unnamed protein product [Adineta steineri]|uniref:ADP ribosyltransferase domain-containing protein n=1 Tax=Adineta steineri TaxID=433720 RepID=A0A819A6E7_9BILA|nr:unnamed protein product [Adineta steineri]CAF3779185.1 unnamed protein product [Adineta steineri]